MLLFRVLFQETRCYYSDFLLQEISRDSKETLTFEQSMQGNRGAAGLFSKQNKTIGSVTWSLKNVTRLLHKESISSP